MVTEVAVPSLLSTREAVGIGDAGDELVVCAGRRCRSRRRWRRSRTCRSDAGGAGLGWNVAALSTSLTVSVPEVDDGGRGIGLGQVADVGGHHSGIVGAEDVDGDRGGGAVAAEHR